MRQWTLQPQECKGTYTFSGRFYATNGVVDELHPLEIKRIINDIMVLVKKKGGIDYLQVFKSNDGRTVFCIDNLNAEMKASGDFDPEHDYWTIMFDHEY